MCLHAVSRARCGAAWGPCAARVAGARDGCPYPAVPSPLNPCRCSRCARLLLSRLGGPSTAGTAMPFGNAAQFCGPKKLFAALCMHRYMPGASTRTLSWPLWSPEAQAAAFAEAACCLLPLLCCAVLCCAVQVVSCTAMDFDLYYGADNVKALWESLDAEVGPPV